MQTNSSKITQNTGNWKKLIFALLILLRLGKRCWACGSACICASQVLVGYEMVLHASKRLLINYSKFEIWSFQRHRLMFWRGALHSWKFPKDTYMEFVKIQFQNSDLNLYSQMIQVVFGIGNIYMNYNIFMAHPLFLF